MTKNTHDGAEPAGRAPVSRGGVLPWGAYDLNGDGVLDALSFSWNGKAALFISDRGALPFSPEPPDREDWSGFFNRAFRAGEPRNPWNQIRAGWGSYTLLVDKDGCGRYDSQGDFCYRAFDINGDGLPEAEYYHLFPGEDWCPWSNKLVCNLNGEPELSYLDFGSLTYPDEQLYDGNGFYRMNVHGSGFFLNSYSAHPELSWETPIAWYDFNRDGYTDMVMRCGDVDNNSIVCSGGLADSSQEGRYSGRLSEFELSFELNRDTGPERCCSLDLHLSFYTYRQPGLDYTSYRDTLPFTAPLPGSEEFYGRMKEVRLEPERRYLPYLDGPGIGLGYPGWAGAFLLFDEDNDDCRWEEMFSNHEGDGFTEQCWGDFSDHIGDRTEKDEDFGGGGQLYIGRFDGKLHLYHAEQGWWEIDYLALFKGSRDHRDAPEGPLPPQGLRYPQVRYLDTTGNGFFDTIVYSVEIFGSEGAAPAEKTICLLDYGDEELPEPDVCPLLRLEAAQLPPKGFRLEDWDGNPLTEEDFAGSSARACYDQLEEIYDGICTRMWESAQKLYRLACRFGLNRQEQADAALRTEYTLPERLALSSIEIPAGYSRHLSGNSRRERYHNGFWLRQKVFADLCREPRLDTFTLERYFYTGRFDRLCDYVEETLKG